MNTTDSLAGGSLLPTAGEVLSKAYHRALGSGVSGMGAMVVQISTLMWLRTTLNYQYRYGTSMTSALRTLHRQVPISFSAPPPPHNQGGIRRFYRGVGFALLQGPLSRFIDTAANEASLSIFGSFPLTASLPVPVKTSLASVMAGGFRILSTPVDACKTLMQVEGDKGMAILMAKMRGGTYNALFHGALGAAVATMVGHYPWFVTYNTLNVRLGWRDANLMRRLARSATIGISASMVSDTCSNSFRVLKTMRQTSPVPLGYAAAARKVIAQDGLPTRYCVNALNSVVFTVVWKLIQDTYFRTGHSRT